MGMKCPPKVLHGFRGALRYNLQMLSHVVAVSYRGHQEGESIVTIVKTILFTRKSTPAVDTAEPHLHLVDTDVGHSVPYKVCRMPVVFSVTVIKSLYTVFKS